MRLRLRRWIYIAIAIPFVMAAAFVALVVVWLGARPLACASESTVKAQVLFSPNGAWEADIDERVCSTGSIASTASDDIVVIRRPGQAAGRGAAQQPGDVFVIQSQSPEQVPTLQWLSPQQLQITVPNLSFVDLLQSSYQGIQITVKFDPDDPVERAKFLAQFEKH